MRERPDDRDDHRGVSPPDSREREHTRRNARQGEMVRQLVRRHQHQAHIERALLGAERKSSS
jgi:hypothetical protein